MEHALTAKVIDLEGVEEGVIKAYARRAVNDHIGLLSDHGAVCDTQPQLVNDQVTSNRDNPLV